MFRSLVLLAAVAAAPSTWSQSLILGFNVRICRVDVATVTVSDCFTATTYSAGDLTASDTPGVLFLTHWPGRLHRFDTTTNTATLVGSTPALGIAYDESTGTLWGNDYENLYRVDPATGSGQLIGPIAPPLRHFWNLAYDPFRDRLVSFNAASGELFEIDRATGAGTLITSGVPVPTQLVGIWVDRDSGRYLACARSPGRLFEIDPDTGDLTLLGSLPDSPSSIAGVPVDLGTRYCSPAVANSTGQPATIRSTGSQAVMLNALTLVAEDLPRNSFAFFLTSRDRGNVAMPGGSLGTLCLGGAIGRYVGPGQILGTGAAGAVTLPVDLTRHPTPTGLVNVVSGDTWCFQAWFRDNVGGQSTSNFTDAIEIVFY